jgi:hypothetical protein
MPMVQSDEDYNKKYLTSLPEHVCFLDRKGWVEKFEKYGFQEWPVSDLLFRIQMVDPNNSVYQPYHKYDTLFLIRK